MVRAKKGFKTFKCVQCGKIATIRKYRVTCSSNCASKYRNSTKRITKYKK